MDAIRQKVNAALGTAFPGIQVRLDTSIGQRLSGLVIWDGFAGEAQIDRQHRMWQAIDSALSKEERLKLGTILTVTQKEIDAATNVAAV